jgi:release factor glutamine methyltransferase
MNASVTTLGKLCEFIKIELKGIYPDLEISSLTDIIISHMFEIPKHEIHIKKEKPVSETDRIRFTNFVKDLKRGKPVQYIIGYTEFFGLKLHVTPDVLIPRPETEEIVKWIIDDNSLKSLSVMDIGTGSGCIAIALKKFLKNSNVHGCDISVPAIEIARENARANGVDVELVHMDISAFSASDFTEIKHFFDLIVSNPPYIPLREKSSININVAGFEPGIALFIPDDDPLIFYRYIADFGSKHLKKNGHIYLEIHEKYGHSVKKLLEEKGYSNVIIRRDINGKDRMIKCLRYE